MRILRQIAVCLALVTMPALAQAPFTYTPSADRLAGLQTATEAFNETQAGYMFTPLTPEQYWIERNNALLDGYAQQLVDGPTLDRLRDALGKASRAELEAAAAALKVDITIRK